MPFFDSYVATLMENQKMLLKEAKEIDTICILSYVLEQVAFNTQYLPINASFEIQNSFANTFTKLLERDKEKSNEHLIAAMTPHLLKFASNCFGLQILQNHKLLEHCIAHIYRNISADNCVSSLHFTFLSVNSSSAILAFLF
ncbi:hypothetical protein Ciccas_004454 [Cichlidogyrus casuarinus]|uniref:Uncharacterized protein n=1 Tax=Cichlidogyrus casuarinus TaxID=1844966 RepID=A0ABD2QBG9_9PLAT